MQKSEIIIGGRYIVRVNNRLTTVRVDAIREADGRKTRYNVTDLITNRTITFSGRTEFISRA